MRFAPIIPTAYIHSIAQQVSTCHMVLAQYCKTSSRYLKQYQAICADHNNWVILDNGACELGVSLTFGELLDVFTNLGGTSVVVVPDSKFHDENIIFLNGFYKWREEFRHVNPRVLFMGVPRNPDQLLTFCGSWVDIVGLNRDFEQMYTGGRATVVREWSGCGKKWHMLGLRRNPLGEMQQLRHNPDVLSVDSSLPYRLASIGRRLGEIRPYPYPINMWEENLSPEMVQFCTQTLADFKSFVEGKDDIATGSLYP